MTIEEFYNEAMKNESLMREIDKAGDENRLARLLQERQVDGTEQQFLDFVKEKRRESHAGALQNGIPLACYVT